MIEHQYGAIRYEYLDWFYRTLHRWEMVQHTDFLGPVPSSKSAKRVGKDSS